MSDKLVDLGREYDSGPCCVSEKQPKKGEKKKSYPTLYISGVKGLDLSTGEISGCFKGKVVSVSERSSTRDGKTTEDYSCEIEFHGLSVDDSEAKEGGLEEAIEKISKKKEAPAKAEKKPYMGDGDDD